ncbi:MAG: hypothetical protein WC797_01740 [Candidatus Paceibacterota bacterium]|jgi:hypothetical protein
MEEKENEYLKMARLADEREQKAAENAPEKMPLPKSREIRVEEKFRFDPKKGANGFPYLVEAFGKKYDLRNTTGNTCIYRLLSENRNFTKEPTFVEVDTEGYIVRAWNS